MSPGELEAHMRALIHREKLDDFDRLLAPRELDEVPLVSRYKHIDSLASLSAIQKSNVLAIWAARHLIEVVAHVEPRRRSNTAVMVSITRWEDLDDLVPEPALPNFWICTDKKRDLGAFRLTAGHSARAQLVMEWLRDGGMDKKLAVYESLAQAQKAGRIYIALRGDSTIGDLVEPYD